MTNKQRAKYRLWNKTMLITEINRLMRENENARADERARTLQEIMPILLTIVDTEGCCYGFEEKIDALEKEYLNSKEQNGHNIMQG